MVLKIRFMMCSEIYLLKCRYKHALTSTWKYQNTDGVFVFVFNLFKVILLSATMPSDVMEVTQHFMRSPIRILVKKEELTLEGIKQFYVQVSFYLFILHRTGLITTIYTCVYGDFARYFYFL